MEGKEVAVREHQPLSIRMPEWSTEEKEIMKGTIAKDLTDAEFKLFIYSAAMMKLNPLAKQVYPVKYEGRMVLQIGIDGFLDHANESGKYRGFTEPTLVVRTGGVNGELKEIPHKLYDPDSMKVISATLGIKHADDQEPMYVTATFAEYAMWFKDKTTGKEYLGKRWKTAPAGQLIKCARALAIRLRFPGMGGEIYVKEELAIDVEFRDADAPGPQVKQLPPSPRRRKTQTVVAPEQPQQASETPVETQPEVVEGEVVDAGEPADFTTSEAQTQPETSEDVAPDPQIVAEIENIVKYLKNTHNIQPGGLDYLESLICGEFGVKKSDQVPGDRLHDLKKFVKGHAFSELAKENHIPMTRAE